MSLIFQCFCIAFLVLIQICVKYIWNWVKICLSSIRSRRSTPGCSLQSNAQIISGPCNTRTNVLIYDRPRFIHMQASWMNFPNSFDIGNLGSGIEAVNFARLPLLQVGQSVSTKSTEELDLMVSRWHRRVISKRYHVWQTLHKHLSLFSVPFCSI